MQPGETEFLDAEATLELLMSLNDVGIKNWVLYSHVRTERPILHSAKGCGIAAKKTFFCLWTLVVVHGWNCTVIKFWAALHQSVNTKSLGTFGLYKDQLRTQIFKNR